MSVIATFAVVAALAFWAIAIYNRLTGLRSRVRTGWRQISVQLARRHDLISTLVTTVRGAMESEPDTLEAVIAVCRHAATATGPADAAVKEGALHQALGRLLAVVERSPELIANQNLRAVQEELTSTEHRVGSARQSYNDAAAKYNTAIRVVPAKIVAGFGNFPAAQLFEITDKPRRYGDTARPRVST